MPVSERLSAIKIFLPKSVRVGEPEAGEMSTIRYASSLLLNNFSLITSKLFRKNLKHLKHQRVHAKSQSL